MKINSTQKKGAEIDSEIKDLNELFIDKSAREVLKHFLDRYEDRIALASSMSIEDQVVTDMLLSIAPSARIFTLDTGQLPQETYDVMEATMKKYGMRFEVYSPARADIETMESEHGPDLFYDSVEMRKHCCHVRKVKPLRRALATVDAWITGLRRDQSVTRNRLDKVERDESNGKVKINPLADWHEEEVWAYIREYAVPYNALYDKGYSSIGCAPCTRAVKPVENVRAGRWWWERPEHKECGLHHGKGKK